jgi:diaminohydroxyphosphoribosylaminopyrimidine deaminase/5-amino-6-(5-phosphoribosylamino)uracil reductase
MLDPNPVVQGKGMAELQRAGIEVDVGIMPTQAEALNPGFVKRMQGGTPYVRLKVAMSLDGRTAMASGESQWITADSARQDGHRLRARSSAMLTGIGTVLHDDPSLTARLGDGIEVVQPLRVVLDSQLRMPATARMLTLKGKTLVYTQRSDDRDFKIRADGLIQAGVDLHMLESTGNKLDLSQVLRHLGDHYAVNEVMVEAGAKLNGALIDQQLVDEVVFYVAPVLMGDSALGAFNLPGITTMQQKIQLVNMRVRAVGEDLKIQAGVQYS